MPNLTITARHSHYPVSHKVWLLQLLYLSETGDSMYVRLSVLTSLHL